MSIKHRQAILAFALTALCCVQSAFAIKVGEQLDNFRLLDHQGNSHELFYYADASAVAILVQGSGCAVAEQARHAFVRISHEFQSQGVEFFMLNSKASDARENFAKAGNTVPVLLDDFQIIGDSMGASQLGEVFVIDPKDWKVVYRGAVDGERAQSGSAFLSAALTNIVAGKPVTEQTSQALACDTLELEGRIQTAKAEVPNSHISYATDVAPILLEKCVSCHRQGGIGPWAMSDYNMVRGFSLMMREVIRTKRMPPWHADPTTGHWQNDRSLTGAEAQTLVRWIEAGAPRDSESDPLAEANLNFPTWEVSEELGEPDYIVELPATEVPATGVLDYIDYYVENPIGRDVWVRAAEVLPGDRTVLHHTISIFGERTFFDQLTGDITEKGALRHYAPGITNRPFPADTGVFLPANSTFEFQMHYTPTGQATVDQTKVGIWVYDEPPTHSIQSFFMQNRGIEIPAYASNHKETKTTVVPEDAVLYSLLPHAHYRGKAAEFRAVYPDNTEEVLLSVPNYDFNWQTAYEFAEPKFLPAGTKIVLNSWWDNSARNLANPDPSTDVEWGDQSWEEMQFAEVTLRFVDKEEAAQLAAATALAKPIAQH